jgi:abhydrolase domain-containing protein 1/3
VLHGLTGSGTEGYIKGACAAATAAGWRCAVLTYRGCGGLALTSPLPYTADGTADAAAGLAAAGAAFPACSGVAAVGFSLGAIILTKYIAEAEAGAWPASPPLTAATCISSPFCLASAAGRLDEPWTPGWVYNRVLASRLGAYFREHEGELAAHPAVADALAAGTTRRAKTVSAWDAAVVASVAGHASAGAYYAAASSAAHITGIRRTPTLFLVAADDPFLGALPEAEVRGSPSTALAVSAQGGHCAFLLGAWPFGRAWSDDVLVQWLEGVRAQGRGRRARL